MTSITELVTSGFVFAVALGGFAIGRFSSWSRVKRLEKSAEHALLNAEQVLADASKHLADVDSQRAQVGGQLAALRAAEALARSHIPRMHEMSLALNLSDGFCACDDCKAWREQEGRARPGDDQKSPHWDGGPERYAG